jgi:hypothetical protein
MHVERMRRRHRRSLGHLQRTLTAGARINFPAVRPESHLIPGYLLASTQIETSGANPFFPARASLDERRALSPDAWKENLRRIWRGFPEWSERIEDRDRRNPSPIYFLMANQCSRCQRTDCGVWLEASSSTAKVPRAQVSQRPCPVQPNTAAWRSIHGGLRSTGIDSRLLTGEPGREELGIKQQGSAVGHRREQLVAAAGIHGRGGRFLREGAGRGSVCRHVRLVCRGVLSFYDKHR